VSHHGSGAAGGVGYAALAVLGAEVRSGVGVVLELVEFHDRLGGARLVVTGEGSLDEQTTHGKAAAGIAAAAAVVGVPVVAVCGRRLIDDHVLAGLGIRQAYPLSDLEPDPAASMANAASLLLEMGRRIARDWLAPAGCG
jgi:glycerate kinase